jgi:hypothetical protein
MRENAHHHEPIMNHVEGWKSTLWGCCWVKNDIEHELWSISIRWKTYSKQKHPLGWGGGGEVSNMTGYRSADSWRAGEEGDMPLRSCWGRARAMGRGGEEGRGRRGSWSEDLAKFHTSPQVCNEINKSQQTNFTRKWTIFIVFRMYRPCQWELPNWARKCEFHFQTLWWEMKKLMEIWRIFIAFRIYGPCHQELPN